MAMLWLGYGFGSIIPDPDPDRYVIPAVILIIIISVLPALREVLKSKHEGVNKTSFLLTSLLLSLL